VTTVIDVPHSLDDRSFEDVFDQLAPLPPDEKILLDARRTRWASPFGLTALLTIAQTRLERPTFAVPENDDTASYWSRASFFKHAEGLYDITGRVPRARQASESSVLLEVTPVVHTQDVHTVVENIQQRAQTILSEKLHLKSTVTMRFTMALSEICQNVIEHASCYLHEKPGVHLRAFPSEQAQRARPSRALWERHRYKHERQCLSVSPHPLARLPECVALVPIGG